MSKSQVDENNTEQLEAEAVESGETEEPETVTEVPEAETADAEKGEAESVNAKGLDGLDGESLRKMVRDLRRESGNYRTQLQKVRDAQVKTEEEFTTLKSELAKRDQELVRERVGAQHGLPAELRSRLQGESEAEIAEDAQKVAAFLKPSGGVSSTNPSGGLNSGSDAVPSTDELAAKIRAQRY